MPGTPLAPVPARGPPLLVQSTTPRTSARLPGQGLYHNPDFIFKDETQPGGRRETVRGYVTDLITDLALDYIDNRDPSKPFVLFYQHKAPHRNWMPSASVSR